MNLTGTGKLIDTTSGTVVGEGVLFDLDEVILPGRMTDTSVTVGNFPVDVAGAHQRSGKPVTLALGDSGWYIDLLIEVIDGEGGVGVAAAGPKRRTLR